MGGFWPILSAAAQPAFLGSPWWLVLAALGVPAAVTGFFIRRLEKSLDKGDKEREEEEARREKQRAEQEANREQMELLMVRLSTAAIALGEATAKAVQRIPDAHCNGDMHRALEYATSVKHDQKAFLIKLGIHALFED